MRVTRTLSFALALILTWMAAYPCSDKSMVNDEANVYSLDVQHDEGESGFQDLCSPFCNCQCCSTQCSQPDTVDIDIFMPDAQVEYYPLDTNSICAVSITVWQPPKIG